MTNTNNNTAANETVSFEEALAAWLKRAQEITGDVGTLSIDPNGKKYIRIVVSGNGMGRSVHCFVDRATGNVLKAEGWKRPAKHARGSIYILGQEGVGRFGAHYLV